MFKMWIKLAACAFMGICAVTDIRKREIPLLVVWTGIAVAILLRAAGWITDSGAADLLMAVLPGIFFWILSFLTKEQVGYGDGWMLLMIGLFGGYEDCFVILMLGLVLESVTALVLLVFRKVSRNAEMPFAPFLLAGMGVIFWL